MSVQKPQAGQHQLSKDEREFHLAEFNLLRSDLPSGIPEIVTAATGFRVPVGDIDGFVGPILALNRNRERLEAMSRAARARANDFDVSDRAVAYHRLFARATELKRPWGGPMAIKHGSRLDQPYLPNELVLAARHFSRVLNRRQNAI